MMLRFVQQSLNSWLCETPSTSVERLFLRPHDSLGIRILVEVLTELGPGKGVELLNTGYGRFIELLLRAVFVKGNVDLAGAEDYAVDLFGSSDFVILMGRVGDDPLEVRFASEVLDRGPSERMTKEGFGEEEYQSC